MSFPMVVAVLKKMMPAAVAVEEPFNVQYRTVLALASAMKGMVAAAFDVLVLLMVRLLSLPVAFTRPSMITLSAPLRLINGVASAPVILNPVVVG